MAGGDLGGHPLPIVGVDGGDEGLDGAAEAAFGQAVQHLGAARPVRPAFGDPGLPGADVGGVEREPHAILGFAERDFRRPPPPPLRRLLQLARHRRQQPRQPVLGHEVARARAHRVDRRLLIDRAGDDDARQVEAALGQHPQRIHRRERRQREVADQQVPLARPERPAKRLDGVDAQVVDDVALAGQLEQDERGIVLGVFDHQHPQRLGHRLSAWSGIVKQIVAPDPTAPSAQIRPPWRRTMRWTMARPMPEPGKSRSECSRWNGANSRPT